MYLDAGKAKVETFLLPFIKEALSTLKPGGFHGDCAGTYPCGKVSDEAMRLIQVTEQSFWEGIKYAKPGNVFVGLPHRLDRPVSGVVVFAKTSKALTRLNCRSC